MKRIEGILARLFIVISSAVIAFMIIEVAANYYLWNLAPEADFKQLASINQIKERYGDDFFINSSEGEIGRLFLLHHYLGYALTLIF